MSAPFSSLHRALAPDEQSSSSQPVDSERQEQLENDRMWRFMAQPPDKPGTDSSVSEQSAENQPSTTNPVQQQQAAPSATTPNPEPQTQSSTQPAPAQPESSQRPPENKAGEKQTNTPPPKSTQTEPDQPPTNPADPNEDYIPNAYKPQAEEVLFEWQSPSRPYKHRTKQYYSTILIIAVLASVILFFANQLVFVAVIAALVFLSYVLLTTPPSTVTQKLTTYGIRVEDNLYYWEELGRFWFSSKHGQDLLHIEVGRFPNRLTMLLGDLKKDDMAAVLSEVLLNEEPPPTTYEKAAQWLQEKLPMEIE